MNRQPKTQIQSGLDLIKVGRQLIATAEISEADVWEAVQRDKAGDSRLIRQLQKKPAYIDALGALAAKL